MAVTESSSASVTVSSRVVEAESVSERVLAVPPETHSVHGGAALSPGPWFEHSLV